MRKLTYQSVMLSALLAWVGLAGCTVRPVDSRIPGYLTTPGGALLYNDEGQCWRTAAWRPALAIPQCDPEVVRRQRALAAVEEETVDDMPADDMPADDVSGEDMAVAEAVPAPELDNGQPVPEAPASRPFLLSADAAFHFGHYRLSHAGEQAVSTLADRIQLRGGEELQVRISGHTDRIGSAGANQALSLKRAESVRDRLVELGISRSAIQVEGLGASRPVTVANECPDDLFPCELIMCLSPDRRVEVEVSGTQTRLLGPRPRRN